MYNKTCPGCGETLGESDLSPLRYMLSRAFHEERLRYRENTRMRIGKLNYCAKCASDFDAWNLKCSRCGKKTGFLSSSKLRGKFFCLDCMTNAGIDEPADVRGNKICITLSDFTTDLIKKCGREGYSMRFAVPLDEKTPSFALYVNHEHLHDYVLETEDGEDLTGKYFQMMVRMYYHPTGLDMLNARIPVQIDGFISDTSEDRKASVSDIGYRFEGLLLTGSGRVIPNERTSLAAKGLRYPGYITPGNVRLVGICPDCGRSLCFKSYNFPMMQAEPVYSDDGTEVSELYDFDGSLNRDNWKAEIDGKTFRYRNDFKCRHCGGTYLDYAHSSAKNHFGLYGCAYLGHKIYR